MQNRKEKKRWETNEESLRELWDIKHTNIYIIGMPEGEEREKGTEKIFKERISKKFHNTRKETLTQI